MNQLLSPQDLLDATQTLIAIKTSINNRISQSFQFFSKGMSSSQSNPKLLENNRKNLQVTQKIDASLADLEKLGQFSIVIMQCVCCFEQSKLLGMQQSQIIQEGNTQIISYDFNLDVTLLNTYALCLTSYIQSCQDFLTKIDETHKMASTEEHKEKLQNLYDSFKLNFDKFQENLSSDVSIQNNDINLVINSSDTKADVSQTSSSNLNFKL